MHPKIGISALFLKRYLPLDIRKEIVNRTAFLEIGIASSITISISRSVISFDYEANGHSFLSLFLLLFIKATA